MRCFSIVSTPHDESLDFAVKVQGQFTQALSRLKVGEKIAVMGPFGSFVLGDSGRKSNLLFAGGIGITPFVSIIRSATQTQSPIPMTLLYSCRSQDDIPFLNELIEQERLNRRFRLYFFVSSGPTDKLVGAKVFPSRINDKWIRQATGGNYQNYNYYLCGPKSLTVAILEILENNSVPNESIFNEAFSQVAKVRLDGRETAQSFVYKLALWAIVLVMFAVGVTDLKQAIPKIAATQIQTAVQTFSAPASGNAAPTSDTAGNSSVNADNSGPPSGSNSAAPSTTTQTPIQSYQAPTSQTPVYYQPPRTAVS